MSPPQTGHERSSEGRLKVGVLCETPLHYDEATALAARLGLPLVDTNTRFLHAALAITEAGLELRDLGGQAPGRALRLEFVKGALGYRRRHGGGVRQALARAVGVKGRTGLRVIDTTAGLGRDGFMLAWLGCHVHLIERSPIIAALLEDGLARALQATELRDIVQNRIDLTCGDSLEILPRLSAQVPRDVIYLDPMYPERSKTALVRKEMRWLRHLVGPDQDSAQLLSIALACARDRVVVKRPKGAPTLDGPPPSFEIRERSSRFDVYTTNR